MIHIPDTDGKPDFTEGKTYEQNLELATGAKYDSLEELIQARSKVSFWNKIKLTWQGKTQVGRITGTALDVAETFAPHWAVKARDIIQSKTKPNVMKTKPKYKSKTIVIFGLLFIAGLLQHFGVDLGLELNPDAEWVMIGSGIVGVILRLVTKKPVDWGLFLKLLTRKEKA